jgi:sterol desaturase/sphingolipid hydroxylase (fatty acid hydroxylase superfamily)
VHHHYKLPYTDSNYGNIFSVWDRLFGTFRTLPKEEIVYGIDTHMRIEEHNELKNLLKSFSIIIFRRKELQNKKIVFYG